MWRNNSEKESWDTTTSRTAFQSIIWYPFTFFMTPEFLINDSLQYIMNRGVGQANQLIGPQLLRGTTYTVNLNPFPELFTITHHLASVSTALQGISKIISADRLGKMEYLFQCSDYLLSKRLNAEVVGTNLVSLWVSTFNWSNISSFLFDFSPHWSTNM